MCGFELKTCPLCHQDLEVDYEIVNNFELICSLSFEYVIAFRPTTLKIGS